MVLRFTLVLASRRQRPGFGRGMSELEVHWRLPSVEPWLHFEGPKMSKSVRFLGMIAVAS
jgi:hypothetical protein